MAEKLDSGQAGMTTGKDDKGFLSFPLVGNLSLRFLTSPEPDGTGASRKDAGQAGMTDFSRILYYA